MGVISFYRGNLHKVPDTPRRWPIPKPSISLQDFKILLEKRNIALQRVEYNTNHAEQPQPIDEDTHEGMGDNGCTKQEDKLPLAEENKRKRDDDFEDPDIRDAKCPRLDVGDQKEKEIENNGSVVPMDCEQIISEDCKGPSDLAQLSDSAKLKKPSIEEMDVDSKKQDPAQDERVPDPDKLAAQEVNKNPEVIPNKLKKKHELESKLKILTEEKHHLVQMLKHILSTEEEMKKRSQMAAQTPAMNVPFSLQGEATVDVGSHVRQAGRRIGTELNCYGDLEEGELEDACTPSPHSHNPHHVHGSTGHIGSLLGRQPNNSIQSSQQVKTSFTAACHSQHNTSSSSPILSALLIGAHGSQTQHVHMSPVSASAAQIGVSSPSPVTSSGTSIFRDTRRASPWNQR